MSIFNVFKKKDNNSSEISVADLNESADYLSENKLLFGKIKPVFKQTPDGKFELSMEHVKAKIHKLGLTSDSLEALSIEDEYLTDVQNVMKHAKAKKIKEGSHD